jgi:hypothetical protein
MLHSMKIHSTVMEMQHEDRQTENHGKADGNILKLFVWNTSKYTGRSECTLADKAG